MSRGERIKEIEDFPKRLKIFFWIIVILLIFGTIGFSLIDKFDLKASFYRTLQTLAFIFEENPSITERLLEIFLAIVGVFLIWWVLWSVADMLLDGNLKRYIKSEVFRIKIKKMENHIIIVGGGRFGEEVAKALKEKNENFIIIEMNPEVVNSLRKDKYLVIEGNAEHEEILKNAKISTAKKAILTLPRTEQNILITLTAKELNPNIEIYSRCENNRLVSKLKKAGAKRTIIPEIVAGDKIVEIIGEDKIKKD
jgi:voltage-gated potassium channel